MDKDPFDDDWLMEFPEVPPIELPEHDPGDLVLVGLDDFVADPALQVRDKTKPEVVRDYTRHFRNGVEFPPIIVGYIGKKKKEGNRPLFLIDGFHRVAAASEAEVRNLKAVVEEFGTEAKARLRAIELNSKHGVSLSSKEKRAALGDYIKAKQHLVIGLESRNRKYKSLREMEKELPLSRNAIRSWLKKHRPALLEKMLIANGNDVVGKGGLPESDAEKIAYRAAVDALKDVELLVDGLGDETMRERLRDRARRLVDRLR